MELKIKVVKGDYQDRFLFSKVKFPALIAGIGTGKTLLLLLKIYRYCEDYPGTTALIVRKEYTDLRDSTIKDFQRYFSCVVDSNKEHKLGNGSVIMFRHASEIEVLKNINLGIAGIEQAEEFETDEQFQFIRDRLRQNNGALVRPLVVIANACGHNWIWKYWINNPQSEDYYAVTANTFENEKNLPPDFIRDLKSMETESPNHYKQFVMNSFEEIGADDILLSAPSVYDSPKLDMPNFGFQRRIMAVDVARYGDDEIVFTIIESRGAIHWEQIHQEGHKNKSLMDTVARIVEMKHTIGFEQVIIDDTGVGGGVTDRLMEFRDLEVIPFNGGEKSVNELYGNIKAEASFKMKEWFDKGWMKILPDMLLAEQLLSIRFEYKNAKKYIVSKDKMRSDGLKSPDRAEALMMAIYYTDKLFEGSSSGRMPQYGVANDAVYAGQPRELPTHYKAD